MSSLADLPELVGFFSYSREDDADSQGALSALRTRIQGELRGQLGRSAKGFRLWQDKEAIASGKLWESEIKNAVAQSIFFIPIITPTVVASPYCRFELDLFLAREAELDRDDLVFPILYIDVPALEDAGLRHGHPVLSLIARRQYMDWRKLRHRDMQTTEVREAIERFCVHIRNALNRPLVPPEDRRQSEEPAAPAQAERSQNEVDAKQRVAEEGRRTAAAEAAAAAAKAEADADHPRREEASAQLSKPPSNGTRVDKPHDMQERLAEWQRRNKPTILGVVVRRLLAVAVAFSAVIGSWAILTSTSISYGVWLVPIGLLWLAGFLWKGWD